MKTTRSDTGARIVDLGPIVDRGLEEDARPRAVDAARPSADVAFADPDEGPMASDAIVGAMQFLHRPMEVPYLLTWR